MDEKICEKCEYQLFKQANPVLCEQCAEKLFTEVKKYIDENPDNSLAKVAEETGVDKQYLKKWIREGRIEYSSPEETERRKKLENLKKDYNALIKRQEQEEQEEKNRQSGGKYHTRDDSDKNRRR